MAAPALSRKPARGESIPAPIKAAGYTAMMNVYWDHLPKCVKGIAYTMLGLVYRMTVGGDGRPDWVKVSMVEFADRLACTEDGAAKAVDWLEKKKLIESEKAGKGRKYRALFENWSKAEPLPVRTLSEDDGDSEVEEAEDESSLSVKERETVKFTVTPGRKARPIDLPNGRLIPEFKCKFPIAMQLTYRAGDIHLFSDFSGLQAEHPYSSTDVSKPHLVKNGSGKEGNTRTPVRMSEELAQALEPVFLHRFHRLPDAKLLRQVASELGDCPIDRFMRTVSARLHADRRGDVTSGLFPVLAREARGAWEKSRPAAPTPKSLPQRATVFEDESSNSLWMQIRLELKARISEIEYSNWISHTAFRSYNGHEGRLSVVTADDLTAEWCGEEYAEKVFEIIRELNLPVKEVVYKPAAIVGASGAEQ